MAIIKLDSNEIFHQFLNLKDIIPSGILFNKVVVCLACGLDPFPLNFLVVPVELYVFLNVQILIFEGFN